MLTAELVRPRLRLRGTELSIEMLDVHDPSWLQTAADLIGLFQSCRGQSQTAWNRVLEMYEGERVDYVVVRGLAKVLTDAATFSPCGLVQDQPPHFSPMQLRERLFAYGPVYSAPHLFQPKTRYEVIQSVADELGVSSEQVEASFFADRPATYLLTDPGPAWTPEGLLARYNLELARGVLYWASFVQIEVHSSYKDLWKYLKLFKLMFWVQSEENGYLIDLDGPISPFVRATTRYGRQFAAFLPALLLCEQWRMAATIHVPQTGTTARYRLDHTFSLQTHFKQSGLFDSRLEADFASEFEQKMGGKRGHWRLTRESEVLVLGDTVMIPDFLLVDEQDENRKILIELVGFWHPEYLRRKVEKVRAANCAHLLLLVYQGLNVTEEAFQDVASEVIFFQQKPVLKEVMETVEAMADRLYGPRQKQKQERKPPKQKESRQPTIDNYQRVKLFLTEHPTAKAREVAAALAMSRTTANKWMQRVRDKNQQQESG
jgi:predicted nuclease of restriction endonuclease-like RecB superfamily